MASYNFGPFASFGGTDQTAYAGVIVDLFTTSARGSRMTSSYTGTSGTNGVAVVSGIPNDRTPYYLLFSFPPGTRSTTNWVTEQGADAWVLPGASATPASIQISAGGTSFSGVSTPTIAELWGSDPSVLLADGSYTPRKLISDSSGHLVTTSSGTGDVRIHGYDSTGVERIAKMLSDGTLMVNVVNSGIPAEDYTAIALASQTACGVMFYTQSWHSGYCYQPVSIWVYFYNNSTGTTAYAPGTELWVNVQGCYFDSNTLGDWQDLLLTNVNGVAGATCYVLPPPGTTIPYARYLRLRILHGVASGTATIYVTAYGTGKWA